jgi:hypothetical protein
MKFKTFNSQQKKMMVRLGGASGPGPVQVSKHAKAKQPSKGGKDAKK